MHGIPYLRAGGAPWSLDIWWQGEMSLGALKELNSRRSGWHQQSIEILSGT